MHSVVRGTGTPKDRDEVNKRETRESDGRAHDPDTMVAPLTPKPTHLSTGFVYYESIKRKLKIKCIKVVTKTYFCLL